MGASRVVSFIMDGSSTTNLPELSVSELAGAVKRTMETTFDRVRVRGELGRVTIAKSGHLYADLKDANASISLVMWRGSASALRFRPEEGLEIVAEGKLTTFPQKSQYQLIADRMEPAGVGALMALLEERKRRLAGEGLFDAAAKRPLPFLPQVIGVVTSPSGAVIRDILHRLEERFPCYVLLWPVLVQGEKAAEQIAAAIAGFNALAVGGSVPRPDLLIVARGGGSVEDLWCFNEEIVVRAAAASRIPLISAVGHETDVTLIDFAADRRAPTPSAAAEIAVPVRLELLERVETGLARLAGAIARVIDRRRLEARGLAARLPRPEGLLGSARQRFDRFGDRLQLGLLTNTRLARAGLDRCAGRLRPDSLMQDVRRRRGRVEEVFARLAQIQVHAQGMRVKAVQQSVARLAPAIQRALLGQARGLSAAARMLETLSHHGVLARGYALVLRPDGSVVRAAARLSAGDSLDLRFADGNVPAIVGVGGFAPKKRTRGGSLEQGSLF